MNILSKSNRAILSEMVRTDFKLRYQGSLLGYLWSLLRPLLLSAVLYMVFVRFLRVKGDIRHYASYLILGIMCWTFFVEVTTVGISSVVSKGDLIRKIAIPRYLTVISSSVSALINFALNIAVLAVIMTLGGVELQVKYLILVPVLIVELYAMSLFIAFLLSAAFVKFRDVSFIWEVFTQMFFYLTPIIYPVNYVLEKYPIGKYMLINPVAQIIQDLRYILITPQTITAWEQLRLHSLITIGFIIALGFVSVLYFKNQARFFAENV